MKGAKKVLIILISLFSAVHKGSQQIVRSKKLKKLLEIVLALGNYMNRGQRGNAKGFLISSLNNMVDTKSSLNRHVTLLHYLVEVLEKRVSINFVTNTKCF